jgi:hypothetical protein
MTYPDYKAWLMSVWIDMHLDLEGEEIGYFTERQESFLHEIEKMIGLDNLLLSKERFEKTMNHHLYAGAEIRVKRDLYYGELHHDPHGQNPGALPYLEAGLVGKIVNVDLTDDESDNGYYDCEVRLADSSKWLMRVEWLEWLEDIEDAGDEY